jgi:pimeloyl-ACP methyl ester carboxylesterase
MGLESVAVRLQAALADFSDSLDGPVHFVGHSMGGLIIRALIHRHRPANLGRVVMLGTPNGGSEIADMLAQSRLSRVVLGNAAPALVTRREDEFATLLGEVDYPAGVIAGNRAMVDGPWARMLPRPHDGKVSVAATHLEDETDHIVLPISHALLPYHREAQRQTQNFICYGCFSR